MTNNSSNRSFGDQVKKIILIISAFLGVTSAFGIVGGVLFQKGVLMEANLAGVEISTSFYDLSYYGYYSTAYIVNRVFEDFTLDSVLEGIWFQLPIILFFSFLFVFSIRNTPLINSVCSKAKERTVGVVNSKYIYPIVFLIATIAFLLARLILLLVFLIPFVFMIAVGVVGQKSGVLYMQKLKSNPCGKFEINNIDEYGDFIVSAKSTP